MEGQVFDFPDWAVYPFSAGVVLLAALVVYLINRADKAKRRRENRPESDQTN